MPHPVAFAPPVISVDVEDWSQSSWDRSLPIAHRAARNTELMLELLSRAGVQATMFVQGKFAEAFPDIVRQIHAAGHEVGSHGFGHTEIFHQSRDEFYEDVRRSKQLLEDIIGERVCGYRAPDFSIVRDTLWALEVLSELGFEYDSSIFPIRHRRYGIPEWPMDIVNVRLPNGLRIVELPIASLRIFGKNLPVGGGGYHRLLPGAIARLAAMAVMRHHVFVYYCHPYELDDRELWETEYAIPLRRRVHQGLGRGRFRARLEAFLAAFGGRPMRDVLCSGSSPDFELSELIAAHGLSARAA